MNGHPADAIHKPGGQYCQDHPPDGTKRVRLSHCHMDGLECRGMVKIDLQSWGYLRCYVVSDMTLILVADPPLAQGSDDRTSPLCPNPAAHRMRQRPLSPPPYHNIQSAICPAFLLFLKRSQTFYKIHSTRGLTKSGLSIIMGNDSNGDILFPGLGPTKSIICSAKIQQFSFWFGKPWQRWKKPEGFSDCARDAHAAAFI